jgi:hypothetical protein
MACSAEGVEGFISSKSEGGDAGWSPLSALAAPVPSAANATSNPQAIAHRPNEPFRFMPTIVRRL